MYLFIKEVEQILEEVNSIEGLKQSTKEVYNRHIKKFFTEFMSNKSYVDKKLDAISYHDLQKFIEGLSNNIQKINHYYSLKWFFDYTYKQRITYDVITGLKIPAIPKKCNNYISEEDYLKIISFITEKNNDLYERLIIGMFIFTGLSREIIFTINKSDIYKRNKNLLLNIETSKGYRTAIPLHKNINSIVEEYLANLLDNGKIIKCSTNNQLTECVKNISSKICGTRYSPTAYSKTFIRNAINKQIDILCISRLTFKSLETVEKHINDEPNIDELRYALNSI